MNTEERDKEVRGKVSAAVDSLTTQFRGESDRGAVLVAAAMIENSLNDLLRIYLAPQPSVTDSLFDGPNAPLGSFAAKIDVAHRIGILSDKFARDLHLIRRIRNDFAHSATSCEFSAQSVGDRVAALDRSNGILERSPNFIKKHGEPSTRDRFFNAVSWMLQSLDSERVKIVPVKPSDAEFGYVVTLDKA